MAGQSINDRITAAKYSLAGQGLAKSVCKATTEEVIGPKKKHLEYLLQCTNEPNVSIPQLANLLIERTQMQSWVTVFKALITVHHLMCYGNERFTQYLASSNCNFNLGNFLDKNGTTAGGGQPNAPQLSYEMSTFIRRYAKYISTKAISYRSVAFDFCKTKRGKEDGTLRTMSTDTLLKTVPVLQNQLDGLLEFDCNASQLNNGVINAAFMLLFRDLIRLFACYNDGIINLLEKYFDMNKKQAREALDAYKTFLIRMDSVAEFLKVAENVGIDKGEIPDLKKAPSSLLDALEAHLASLEGKKVPTPSNNGAGLSVKNAVSVLSSTSSSFGFACSNGRIDETSLPGTNGSVLDEVTKRHALAEEEAMYEKLRTEHSKHNPFLSSPTAEFATAASGAPSLPPAPELDLFGGAKSEGSAIQTQSTKASDDLLQLGNPFAEIMGGPTAASASTAIPNMSVAGIGMQQQPQTNGFCQQGFVNDNAFAAVFGYNSHASSTFGEILQPEGKFSQQNQPMGATPASQSSGAKLITSDLDFSLSSLVENLNITAPATTNKQQWSSPKAQSKTGGTGWAPTGTAAPAMGYRQPSPGSMGGQPPPQQWGAPVPQGQPMGMMTQPATGMLPQQGQIPTNMPSVFDHLG